MGRVIKVKHVHISTFSHATEDPVKVRKAVLNLIPQTLHSVRVSEEILKGHYGNEIRVLNVEFHGDDAFKVLKHIICSLSQSDRNALILSLALRLGDVKSHLHLRLDKQEAYLGTITLRDGSDVIKCSITIDGCRTLDDVKNFLNELLGEC